MSPSPPARRRPLLISLTMLAVASTAASAPAATVRSENVASPGKRITCWAVMGSTEIECTAPYLPDIGELDTYLALRPRGTARLAERGDFPGFPSRQRTLRYGDTWRRPGIDCALSKIALRCRNRDGHGFHIERGAVRRF